MSNGMPWFPFFPGDWLAGTRGLSAHATAVYITLLALIYERDEPVKNDPKHLARYCSMTRIQFTKALSILIEKKKIVVLESGELWNERAAQEIQKRIKAREVQKQKAILRWGGKTNENNDKKMPKHSSGITPASPRAIATQSPESEKKKEEPAGAGSKKKIAHRLSESWKIPPDWLTEAEAEGLPRTAAFSEAEKMKNWSLSNPRGAKLDWHATWRNWFRQAIEQRGRPAAAAQQSSFDADDRPDKKFMAEQERRLRQHG